MSATGSCPGCGAALVFRVATTTTVVCEYCQSIVVRGGAQLELVGKSNAILATGSVLKLGLEGTYKGKAFVLVGRVQLQHDLGGLWDEWLVAYTDGKLAWLAEHQGRFALTTEVNAADAPLIRTAAQAEPGKRYFTPFGEVVVVEHGEATLAAEEGELPEPTLIGARRPFVDFAASDGRVATLDFGTRSPTGLVGEKRFFIGREVTTYELGLAAAELQAPVLAPSEGVTQLACPQCGSPVEKKLTESESLVCSSCSSVLSVEPGNQLGFLFAQERLRFGEIIPLGTRARLDEGFFRMARRAGATSRPWPAVLDVELVAHVVKSVLIDGVRYFFHEHLLHTERDGFFWLVESDGEWLFVRNLNPGLVQASDWEARLEGQTFRFDQQVTARVEQVTGELYFRLTAGETSELTDFKNHPRTLSREKTEKELVWTECLSVPRTDIQRAFGISPPAPPAEDFSGGESLGEQPPAVQALVLIVFLIFVIFVITAGDCGGGGGGGGFHFGK